MGLAFWGTNPNLNWAVNRLNEQHGLLYNLLQAAQTAIDDQAASGSATATNEQVEQAVQWAVNKATSQYITYSQSNRNLKNVNGTSYDCSSFIITAFYAAGININATYTGDMRAGFTAAGWKWHPGSSFASSELKRGDILLNEHVHTQMYIGNNQDVNCGSTPAKVMKHNVNNYGRGWNGFLRYGE